MVEVFQPRKTEYLMDARLQHSGMTEGLSFRIYLAGVHFGLSFPNVIIGNPRKVWIPKTFGHDRLEAY